MAPPIWKPPIPREQAFMRAVPTWEKAENQAKLKIENERRIAQGRQPIVPKHAASSIVSAPTNSKHQKQKDKREELMRKVRAGGISKAPNHKKRRRPAKKLQAAENMEGMRDALPDLSDDGDGEDAEWEGFSEAEEGATAVEKRKRTRAAGGGKIKMRSLQHRPGAMKRKRKMEGVEMERFGRNLAQLSANSKAETKSVQGQGVEAGAGEDGGGNGAGDAQRKEKWAALRAFIGSTLERKDAGSKS